MDLSFPLPAIVLGQTTYPGLDGFLPFGRGSLMLDVVFVAMLAIVPLLMVSVYLVKYQRRYALHKKLQLAMAAVLLVAVLLFEIDIRVNGWEARAEPSPYFDAANKFTCPAGISLVVHLSFAVPTLVLWIVVVVQALRKVQQSAVAGTAQPVARPLGHAGRRRHGDDGGDGLAVLLAGVCGGMRLSRNPLKSGGGAAAFVERRRVPGRADHQRTSMSTARDRPSAADESDSKTNRKRRRLRPGAARTRRIAARAAPVRIWRYSASRTSRS